MQPNLIADRDHAAAALAALERVELPGRTVALQRAVLAVVEVLKIAEQRAGTPAPIEA